MPPKKSKKAAFQSKELVLAKMHGFPAWPSFVMPLDLVPDAILQAKKKTTNFCVIFIPDGDFYWMNEKNLESLSEEGLKKRLEKISSKTPKKKSGTGRTVNVNDALLATKDLQFEDFMKQLDLDNQDNEEDDDDELEEEEEAEFKEEEEVGEEEDEEEEEEEEEEDEYSAKADNEDEEEGEEEEEEETSNVKLEDEDEVEAEEGEEEEEEEEESSIISGLRHSRSLKRSNRKLEPKLLPKRRKTVKEERPRTPSTQAKKTEGSPKTTSKEERQQQLWLCRIKLQRTLIQRNQPVTPSDPKQFPPPTADELLVARLILHRLVDFPMTLEFLKSTKIHKVLKCILRNKDLEYSDSFKLHEKCNELLDKWADIINELKVEKAQESKHSSSDSKSLKPQISAGGDESEFSGVDTSLPLKGETKKESNGKGNANGIEEESEDTNDSTGDGIDSKRLENIPGSKRKSNGVKVVTSV